MELNLLAAKLCGGSVHDGNEVVVHQNHAFHLAKDLQTGVGIAIGVAAGVFHRGTVSRGDSGGIAHHDFVPVGNGSGILHAVDGNRHLNRGEVGAVVILIAGGDVSLHQAVGVQSGTGPAHAEQHIDLIVLQRVSEAIAQGVVTGEDQLAFQLGTLDSLGVVVDQELIAVVVESGGVVGRTNLDLNLIVLGHQTLLNGLVVSGVEQLLRLGQVVAGDGIDSLVDVGIHLTLAVVLGHTPEVSQNLLGHIGGTVSGTVVGIRDDQVGVQAERGAVRGRGGQAERAAVQREAHSHPEFRNGDDGLVDAGAGRSLRLLQSGLIGVEDHGEGGIAGGVIAVVGQGIGLHILLAQAVAVQLALQKQLQTGGSFGNEVNNPGGGLVLAVGQAVVVLVALQDILLVGLERGQLVGAEGYGGLGGGAVGVGVNAVGHGSQRVVQVGLDQIGVGHGVVQIKAGQGLVDNVDQLIVAQREDADFFPRSLAIGEVIGDIVSQVVLRFVAPGIGAGEGVQGGDGFIGDGNEAVLISGGRQHIPAAFLGNVAGALVVSQRTAAHPGITLVQAEVNLAALSGGVGAVLALDQVGEIVSHSRAVGGVGLLDGLVGLQVVLGIVDDHVAGVGAVSAVVLSLGSQQALVGLFIVVGSDGGAVLPLQVVPQGDLPCLILSALFQAVLADVVGSHVFRIIRSHAGNQRIAVFGFIVIEAVQASRHIIQNLRISVGLVGVGVPVGGENSQRGVVGVGCLCIGSGSRRAIGGGSRSLSRLLAAGCQGEHHGQSQQQSDQLLHFLFLLLNFIYSWSLLWWFPKRSVRGFRSHPAVFCGKMSGTSRLHFLSLSDWEKVGN